MESGTRRQEYQEVLSTYKEFAKNVAEAAEATTIQLDRLIVEMGKLTNDELATSLAGLRELDRIIMNTKLYQK
jgi:hypothetical protein